MEQDTDFEKKFIYDFKSVKCILVKFGDHEIWKKGEHDVQKPSYVAYNETTKRIVVRDSERAVTYKKETNSDNWKQDTTTERPLESRTGAQTGSSVTSPPSSGDGQSSNNLSGGSSVAGELKLFKDDGNGNAVEMVDADYEKKYIYDVKSVKCILVKFEDKDVWKKGDNNVDEPNYVAYNNTTKRIVVRDSAVALIYGIDDVTKQWKLNNTVRREKGTGTAKTAGQAGLTGSHSTGLPSTPQPESGGSSAITPPTDLSGSLASTPLPSSGGDGSTVKPDQDGTATPPGSSTAHCASKSISSGPVIKLFQKDPSDANKTIEIDQSNYTVTNAAKHITYKFKKNVICSLVTCNDKEVWNTGKNDISSPKFVTYYINWHNRMAIGDGKKAVFYQFDDSEWKYLSTIAYIMEGKSDELVVNYGGQCFNYKKGSDGKWSYDEDGTCTNLSTNGPIQTTMLFSSNPNDNTKNVELCESEYIFKDKTKYDLVKFSYCDSWKNVDNQRKTSDSAVSW
ncbi:hypothetical protein MACK_002516 [Theileria orientalis]|uniref:Uncharacterized protein n=1 Tax=Theileria orientalis TaxID=68886 RepID=A0A976MD28_THEOR|nr:hypothetical protein MACK_002516 [Theileria orientalis]